MSIVLITNSIINDLQDILKQAELQKKQNPLVLPGVIIVAAQHKINLYLSSIGIDPFIMVDCDRNGKLTLTNWKINESRTGSGKN